MSVNPRHDVERCPIAPITGLLAGRWTAEIIWVLDHEGSLRFSELQRRLGAITPKVLAGRLKQLEDDGFISRTYHREMPPRVVYEATELAHSLRPLFAAMAAWCAENTQSTSTVAKLPTSVNPTA